ncbi:hypothetical protein Rsub_05110 [Raphidocelis subcapitata]|uniref:Uncharacterized protein n=1 Tax=Raphidocelis subcapitata TaxID=307507 RepID=A0A2V0NYM8_9CHLO|nr:hypothetical protein Rsub_05110 [Raphidocelis subcapitata]|eukprot:GBF92741.1 hypothetical protein Rsub_05110 [Raphidocelis subcapitata]
MLPLHALGACGCGGAASTAAAAAAAAAAAMAAARHGGAAALLTARRGLASDARGGAKATTAAPITPDREGAGTTGGRSSEVASVKLLTDERLLRAVDDIFALYEARDLSRQRRLIRRLYARDGVYQNNIMRIQGHDALMRRFGLLPRTTKMVRVLYEPPVVLGATTSSPGALGRLSETGDLEVEIKNSQHYEFDHPGLLRLIVTPRTDVELPVLTRLAFDRATLALRHHQDVWLDKASIWGPLRRGWGAVTTAAAAASGVPADNPGRQPRRPHKGEEGEQSEAEEDASRERVGEQGGRGREGEDSGLPRGPPEVVPA